MANKKKMKAYVKKKYSSEREIIEKLRSKYNTIDVTKSTKFSDLPLSKNTLMGLKESNYVEMTDIQRQSIGLALQGNDILGAAKTGSGKTLAFLVPILEALYCKQWTQLDGVGALVITPTRELAYQIYETLRKVGQYHDISASLIIGGKDLKFEKKRMHQYNIIICTPGRLLQHMDENPLFDCVNMEILVLDEADRCLDMGFETTMNAIIANLPSKRQTLLFSATQTKSVKNLARLSLKDPLYVSVHEHSTHITPDSLQQSYVVCSLEDKMAMLWSFIRHHLKQKIIVFFSTCKQVKYMYEAFCQLRPGVSLLALYGTLHQLKRMNIYESFCRKQYAVLFATDIAARGLDFPAVNWVVQMDCPEDVNAYIHRAGRTARFKSGGESLLILLPSEEAMVERLQQRKIPINMIKINPNKLQSPHRKLEAMLAQNVALKETAQRAFITYIKSIFLMKDKEIFNVHALNTDAYAASLGLVIPPRIRFLQRMQKKISAKSADSSKQQNSEHDSDQSDISDINNENKKTFDGRKIEEKDIAAIQFNDSDDDDVLTVKRENVNIDDILVEDDDQTSTKNKKKAVTKAAVAKKILKKKIVVNKKITFDDEGEELIDSTKTRMSELARQYENEVDSGINIETAKKIMREEDRIDRQRDKQRIREKHRKEKMKLKAAKEAMTKKDTRDKEGMDSADNDDFSEAESSEGPDTSWLPDPDKIYGKQRNTDEKTSSDSEWENEEESEEDEEFEENEKSEEDEEFEEESTVHRPSKRKLVTQEEHKRLKKRQKVSNTADLQADEELALQLLQN